MAERIGIRELRENLSATLRRVGTGVVFEVTSDGEPVAVLAPVPRDRLAQLERAGELTRAEAADGPIRTFRPVAGPPTQEIISRDRDDR